MMTGTLQKTNMVFTMNDREFIKYIKGYLPTRSREDAGVDYNVKQIHYMIDKHLKTTDIKEYIENLLIGYQEEASTKWSSEEERNVAYCKYETLNKIFEILNEGKE